MSETSFRIGGDPDVSPSLSASEVFAEPSDREVEEGRLSPLDGLRLALQDEEKVTPDLLVLRVPSRPGVTVACLPDFDDDKRKAWVKRATRRNRRVSGGEEVDELMFAGLVLANTCVEVRFDGEAACDEEGTPLSFRHKMLWGMVGATDPLTAIRKLFANDAHVLVASNDVLMDAGYDDDLSVDPTGA